MATAAGIARVTAGQGFIAATNWNLAGNSHVRFRRATTTTPVSSGSRNASSALRGNSGSSSRNNTPRCASDNSPGRSDPPPISAAIEAVCCGQRNGRRPPRLGLRPAADSKLATSRISGADRGGSNPGNLCARSVLPAPGGPIIKSPCSPAAAISKARLAAYWPRTSERSGTDFPRACEMIFIAVMRILGHLGYGGGADAGASLRLHADAVSRGPQAWLFRREPRPLRRGDSSGATSHH